MPGINMTDEQVQSCLEKIDDTIIKYEEQEKKIDERFKILQKRALTPLKTKLLYYRNRILCKDNLENLISMCFPYLIKRYCDIEILEEEREVIETAVNWWIEQIKKPLHECGYPLLDAIARMNEAKFEPLTEANIEMFKISLTRILSYELQHETEVFLEVYRAASSVNKPSFYLRIALYLANINKEIHSSNASMIVSKNDVKVKENDSDKYHSIMTVRKYRLTR